MVGFVLLLELLDGRDVLLPEALDLGALLVESFLKPHTVRARLVCCGGVRFRSLGPSAFLGFRRSAFPVLRCLLHA